jgi:hypothetical protein
LTDRNLKISPMFYILMRIFPNPLFDVIVNSIVFLISFSIWLLLEYRNVTDFSILILYPATLLNVFMRSESLLWNFQSLVGIRSYHWQIGIIWLLFPYLHPFYSFLLSYCSDRNSSTILKKSRESDFFPDFWGNSFSFSPFSMMLAIGLSDVAFIMLRCVLSIPSFSRGFTMKKCWILLKAFSFFFFFF